MTQPPAEQDLTILGEEEEPQQSSKAAKKEAKKEKQRQMALQASDDSDAEIDEADQ